MAHPSGKVKPCFPDGKHYALVLQFAKYHNVLKRVM